MRKLLHNMGMEEKKYCRECRFLVDWYRYPRFFNQQRVGVVGGFSCHSPNNSKDSFLSRYGGYVATPEEKNKDNNCPDFDRMVYSNGEEVCSEKKQEKTKWWKFWWVD